MDIYTQAAYNIDLLEGAMTHMLQICGCLSTASLDRFAEIFTYCKGHNYKSNYAEKTLLPRMRKEGRAFEINSGKCYSANPIVKPDKKMQDAFWVFLEFMMDVNLHSVATGFPPAQITFSKNQRLYHIISVEKEGTAELIHAARNDISIEERIKNEKGGFKRPEERYIVVFSSLENAKKAKVDLKKRTLYSIVSYPENSWTPEIVMVKPENLQ